VLVPYIYCLVALLDRIKLLAISISTKILNKPIQNLTDFPELPTLDPLQPIVLPHKAWNQLPISFSKLDAITPIRIFKLFLTNFDMGQLVANTTSYAQQQFLGPEKEWQHSWQPVTAQELYLWLAIQIHMDLIGVPPETSAKNFSVRAEWLLQSGRTPSEQSETPRWRITPCPPSFRCVAFHIAL